ncbi:alpha-galactosidase [Butyrivibrio sp. YAB3001]|uniref:alpha-galactosidase n=1 Tax=Butyrivibrio sp. YAB3001 TaxID=1520812 RepID=UPI0008F63EE6|nr:alpha-galactosidase [Butyrivibrio sp. YAB3001]SFC40278.1 alpha-galactosidase [Butyrivibrio sp. YAB3001]
MIFADGSVFLLQTRNTSYLFRKTKSGHLEHIHFGGSIVSAEDYEKAVISGNAVDAFKSGKEGLYQLTAALSPKHVFGGGNMNVYSDEHSDVFLEMLGLEMSSFGKGDIREPFVELTYADGSSTVDFLYDSFEISDGKKALETLPSSYDDGSLNSDCVVNSASGEKCSDKAQQLFITLKDKGYGAKLTLIYTVFPDCDVITRSAVLCNESDNNIVIDRLMSTQIDFDTPRLKMISFHGRWADEMGKHESVCTGGKVVCEELAAGESGSRSNPFVIVSDISADDDHGDCYGFNLVYSGNHYEALSSNAKNISRFVTGIQPVGFDWLLAPGERFEAPEAVMTFSAKGMNAMSINMHNFVRKHIVRGSFRDKVRPILINSWEAAYFNFTQGSLLSLAKEAKKCGIELFVMDDGWFGQRNDDKTSLGDWYENKKKLPGGIKELADKINALGMMFGIWVEPEMVNEESDLYRAHPDWAVSVPGHDHSKGRNQMNLDLTMKEVQDYVIESMKKVFSAGNVEYVKWDMNRIFSDRYSKKLSADRQGEFQHRYYLGLYRIMKELTESFPDILFEGCSAGGNRFDLGILSYFPQIWGSDDTDAFCRLDIQRGYSYGYPASCVGAHVSACPNHQTLNNVPLETRFEIACPGCFGYELNLCEMSDGDKKVVADQVEFYKKWREVFQFGNYYRLPDYGYMIVSQDKKKAVAFAVEKGSRPNNDYRKIKCVGLDDSKVYKIANRVVPLSLKEFGSLVNAVAPVHVKQDGIIHNIMDKVVHMNGEQQTEISTGAALNNHGFALNASFAGTGYNENVRIMRTGDTRLYMMEEV